MYTYGLNSRLTVPRLAPILAALLACGCGPTPSVSSHPTPIAHASGAASQYAATQAASAVTQYTASQASSAALQYAIASASLPETPSASTPNPTLPVALAQLEAALRELTPVAVDRLPGDVSPTPPGKLALSGGNHGNAVQRELADLRAEVAQLRTDMDMYLGQYLTELRRENEDLRRDLQLARAGQGPRGFAPDLPNLPNLPDLPAPSEGAEPGGAVVPGAAGAPPADASMPTAPAAESGPKKDAKTASNETVALAVHGGLNYAVITEWGRSPQDVAQLGGKASSLKGMVCVVPDGSSNEQVIALGRFFRTEFKDYDNINIEVFDNRAAAQTYVETNNAAPEHRVLSVSKHRQSGRDTILVLRNGALTEVGPGG